jgi:hypothetical protein
MSGQQAAFASGANSVRRNINSLLPCFSIDRIPLSGIKNIVVPMLNLPAANNGQGNGPKPYFIAEACEHPEFSSARIAV